MTSSTASHDVLTVILKAETKFFCHIMHCKSKLGPEIRDYIIESVCVTLFDSSDSAWPGIMLKMQTSAIAHVLISVGCLLHSKSTASASTRMTSRQAQ